jgi:hypothetical protein
MRIARLASASIAAIGLAVTVGSVSVLGQSGTLDGVKAVQVASVELVSPSAPVTLENVTAVTTASRESVFTSAQFATLKGVKALPMTSKELDAVKGLHVHFLDGNGGFHLAGNPEHQNNWENLGGSDGKPVAPSYHGLCVAAGLSGPGGGISIPGGALECP